jgi:sulfatase modifying factor 1
MNTLRRLATAALVALMLVSLTLSSAHAITIDWVTVGNLDNANDTTGYGAVDHEYKISKYEVTIQQYTDFLNSVDPNGANPYDLYNNSMATDHRIKGISFTSGAISGSKYSPMGSSDRPITYVNWFDAARFANWMHNGQGSGSTETGAYTLVGGQTSGTAPAKNSGAQFYIPTENEWYKAAYYSPLLHSGSGGYYAYATQSNTAPGNIVGAAANQANYVTDGKYAVTQAALMDFNQNYLTDKGVFTNSASYYGTFDQNGNVWEWNDRSGVPSVSRGLGGGMWSQSFFLSSSEFGSGPSSTQSADVGFRLASPVAVPEPSTYAMALAGLACGGYSLFRRRKQA